MYSMQKANAEAQRSAELAERIRMEQESCERTVHSAAQALFESILDACSVFSAVLCVSALAFALKKT